MIKSMVMVLTSAVLAVSLPASAHTDEYFDTHAAPHGGQVRMAGPYPVPFNMLFPAGSSFMEVFGLALPT